MFAKKAAPKVCKYGNGKDFSNFQSKKLSKMAIHWFVIGNTKHDNRLSQGVGQNDSRNDMHK